MEEDKKIKRKKVFKMIYKIISYTIICILMAIAAFLIFYVISGKIAQKQGKKPLFGLYTIISPSMTGTLNVYDVAFTMRIDTDKLKEGDIITFYSTNSFFGGTPITHRIIEVVNVPNSGKMFRVKGDANPKADEEKVIPSNVVGKVMFKIPQLGRVQFIVASKAGWFLVVLLPAMGVIIYDVIKLIKLLGAKATTDKVNQKNKRLTGDKDVDKALDSVIKKDYSSTFEELQNDIKDNNATNISSNENINKEENKPIVEDKKEEIKVQDKLEEKIDNNVKDEVHITKQDYLNRLNALKNKK